MENRFAKLFWVITDILLIFGFVFFPSFFSICSFLLAIIFAPVDSWQNLLDKFLKKPIKSIIIALGVALVISFFPISEITTGIHKLITPPAVSPDNTSSVVYYEETPSYDLTSSEFQNTTSDLTNSEFNNESSVISNKNTNITSSKVTPTTTTSKPTSTSSKKSKPSSSSTPKETDINKDISNLVYRTPSGKRYHISPTCGGENSYEVTLDEATEAGLTPCKKCVK